MWNLPIALLMLVGAPAHAQHKPPATVPCWDTSPRFVADQHGHSHAWGHRHTPTCYPLSTVLPGGAVIIT